MRHLVALLVLLFVTASMGVAGDEIPESLRGGIETNQETIEVALEMQAQGWGYTMPRPKSAQARWGNTDGRTTWWVGYWTNRETGQTSASTPKLSDGQYVGDGAGGAGWRRGGSPGRPSELEWLLSDFGGITPRASDSGTRAVGARETKVVPKKSQNADITVYVTKTGSKYHRSGCRYLKKSRIPMDLKDAKARYSPCKVCKPPR